MLNRHFHSLVLIGHLHTSLSVDTQQSACINLNCTTSLLYSNLYVFNSIDNTDEVQRQLPMVIVGS